MTTKISPHEAELLSAYLDGQLTPKERSRLEARLREDVQLRSLLVELRRTRAILRSQPRLRAPRNFMLTPQMAGKPARTTPRAYPALRLASVLAGLLFVLVLAGDLLTASRQTAIPQPAANQAARQVAPKLAVIPSATTEALPAMAPNPQAAAPPTAAADALSLGAGAPTEAPSFAQLESPSTPTETASSMAAAAMQKLAEAEQTETAEAAPPTTLPSLPPMGKVVPVSPTETASGIQPTEEPTEAPASEPTLESIPEPTQEPILVPPAEPTIEPTPLPIPAPTQEPTLAPLPEPTQELALEPTPYPLPQPEVSAAQEQAHATVYEPAYPPAEQLSSSPDRTILRVAEVFIATIALVAGLIAIYLRRIGRG
jgi:Putative zinc-finger